MARSAVYDKWEDVGLAFSVEEVADYDPKVLGEKRIAHLMDAALVMERRSTLPKIDKPAFCHQVARDLLNRATGYCRALTLPGIDKSAALTLPHAGSAEGKALTARAVNMDIDAWLVEEIARVEACLRYAVSIGRRAESRTGWRKTDRSLSNKLANALVQEHKRWTLLREEYYSLPVSGKPKKRQRWASNDDSDLEEDE